MSLPPNQPVVTVHLWGVRSSQVPGSFLRMATHRIGLRRTQGLKFAKLIGTGSGQTFSVRDADLHHWGLIAVWNEEADARVFELSQIVQSWDHHSYERCRFVLQPIYSRGAWAGTNPFELPENSAPRRPAANVPPSASSANDDGWIASITRARIPVRFWRTFAQAVPPVAGATDEADGLVMRTGIGEAPIGLQGTFSVWRSSQAINQFAYQSAHMRAIDQTKAIGWYSEELFARFRVLSAAGSFASAPVGNP